MWNSLVLGSWCSAVQCTGCTGCSYGPGPVTNRENNLYILQLGYCWDIVKRLIYHGEKVAECLKM